MLFLEDFLLNMLIISSPFMLYPYIRKVKNKYVPFRVLLYLLCATAIIVTMCFPVYFNGLTYDFRSVPLVLGSLYGGGAVSFMLFVTLMAGRFWLGYPATVIYAMSFMPSYFIVLTAIRWYKHAALSQKILLAMAACTLVKLITFTAYLSLEGKLELFTNKPLQTLLTYAMQAVIIGLSVYFIEFVNRYYEMQEEVVKSEKMRLISDMAASVAHEIRNPLTSVRGFVYLLGTSGLNAEKRKFYKEICFSELERAEHIISDYLSLTKTDPETMDKLDLNAEIQYLSNILSAYARLNRVQLNVMLTKGTEPCIMGDRNKFRQALINIGKNAIEAMPDGGILELVTDMRSDKALVSIQDTGHGMSQEQLRRLGTPYYSTKEKGTGLGTMISFSIIKKMEGKIDIRSEEGKGTTFTLAFRQYKI
ncbi:ATP-binding protein [Paenibacillus sp. GCM10027627]|uniref:ATP-binding protein n=1 Tax=unclassified Paenibacillus TaxID=185978 RepID=UPI003638E5F1